MFEIGRVCVKLAGRDSGLRCVIVDEADGMLLIDGQTRRRKCNPAHLEPTAETVSVKKGASSEDVAKALEKLGYAMEKKGESRSAKEKPKSKREQKPVKKEKPKSAKKASKKKSAEKKEADKKDSISSEKDSA